MLPDKCGVLCSHPLLSPTSAHFGITFVGSMQENTHPILCKQIQLLKLQIDFGELNQFAILIENCMDV